LEKLGVRARVEVRDTPELVACRIDPEQGEGAIFEGPVCCVARRSNAYGDAPASRPASRPPRDGQARFGIPRRGPGRRARVSVLDGTTPRLRRSSLHDPTLGGAGKKE